MVATGGIFMVGKNLYGTIIGDVVGSRFEGKGNTIKRKGFNLFGEGCRFTDDTVMTIAVADALLESGASIDSAKIVKSAIAKKLRPWGRKYPNAGYGRKFSHWLEDDAAGAYGSFGNGAAMRVSPVAYFYDDLETVRRVARWSAEVTHNHPEGVKGAESVAAAIFLARTKTAKSEIKSYVEKNFGYDLSRTLDEIRPTYRHEISAAQSVPEAIIAFLESDGFEDAIRNAVSLGGDSDTLAAIAGEIAAAFYGVPDDLAEQVNEKLTEEIQNIIGEFNYVCALQVGYVASLNSAKFDSALENFRKMPSPENRAALAQELRGGEQGAFFIIPLTSPDTTSALMSYGLPPFRDMSSFFLRNKQSGREFLVALTDFRELANLSRHFNFDAYFRMIDRRELLREFIANGKEICEGIVVDPAHIGQLLLTVEEVKEILDGDKVQDKSAAYKNLVARAKAQYPEYRADIKPDDSVKKHTSEFYKTFTDKQKFFAALKSKGITWNESTDERINIMRASMALSKAVACGFDPKAPVALFAPTVDGINICDEINLYTYWQGFGYAKNTPKIKYLLVAQDWGNFIRATDEFKIAVAKMNAGEDLFYPFSLKSTTDRNLIELFEILGRDITKPCADVFFTNFCLGYRLGNGGGGMTKDLMLRDKKLFRELCEILEPENILCLGRITSEAVYETLTGEPFKHIFGDAESYNDFLDNHEKFILQYGDLQFNYYPLAHCGSMGTANRPLDKQREDWTKICL